TDRRDQLHGWRLLQHWPFDEGPQNPTGDRRTPYRGRAMLKPSMSALGQKQTCAMQKGMSVLAPKADVYSAIAHVRVKSRHRQLYPTNSSASPAQQSLCCSPDGITRCSMLGRRRANGSF